MIITTEDIRAVRPIAENVNDIKRLVPYIDECEKLYLLKSVGAVQFKKIEDKSIANYSVLMDGGYYDNETKYFAGLRAAMGYLVYSRFVRNQNINATAFGIVAKQGQFSETIDEKTIVRIANDAEKIGLEYLKQCVDYLNFGKEKNTQTISVKRNKFRVIGD